MMITVYGDVLGFLVAVAIEYECLWLVWKSGEEQEIQQVVH